MKKTRFLLFTCLTAFALASCSENEPDVTFPTSNDVRFDAAIERTAGTRASGTIWDPADAIGVYMKAAGSNLSAATDLNVKYTTVGNGSTVFTAATTGIQLPADGSNVDFISYYPYQTTINGFTYPINVSNQSNLPAIDLLYSNNATGANKTNPAVALNFKHMLSQVILNISASSSVGSLTGLTLSVQDLKVDGTFDLTTGAVTLGSTVATVTPTVSATSTVNAIFVPGQDLATATFTFALNGKTYKWQPTAMPLESGKKYTYTIQLTTSGVVDLNPSGNIQDWIEGNLGGAGVVLTPSDDPSFTSDKANITLTSAGAVTETIQLTTQSTQAWTASSSDISWLTVSPASGTGSGTLTLNTVANTGAQRSAAVTITPTGGSLSPITITVTQPAGTVTPPTGNLVFPGSDFEDWSAFTGCLNEFGLKYAVQSTTGGRGGSSALYLNQTTTSKNDYVFTASLAANITTSPTKIIFYIKGTSAKSLSLNVYRADGDTYDVFNLDNYTAETVLNKAELASNGSGNGANAYTGTINTNGNWMKVTLNISDVDLSKTAGQSIFALKVGKTAAYDLYIDDITFE